MASSGQGASGNLWERHLKLTRRQVNVGLAASAIAPAWLTGGLPSAAQNEAIAPVTTPPNIVLILADDLGYGDLSCYRPTPSASPMQTPNIDALAASGVRYTDAHSPSSVCTPTRYGILTGRYCWRDWLQSGVLAEYGSPLLRGKTTIATLLNGIGYTTAHIGKWHLGRDWSRKDGTPGVDLPRKKKWPEADIDLAGPISGGPLQAGFQTSYGVDIPNNPPYAFIFDNRIVGDVPTLTYPGVPNISASGLQQAGFDPNNTFAALKSLGLGRLDKAIDQGRPFFLYLPLVAPHIPLTPSAAFVGSTTLGPMGDYIREMDAHVGDIINLLDARGVRNDTLVIFASDNGSPAIADNNGVHGSIITQKGYYPNYPWSGLKRADDLKEGGHRIPLILNWPTHIAPAVISRTVVLTDLTRTMADVAGATVPADMCEDSQSLAPDWSTATQTHSRDAVIMHGVNGHFAIRIGDMKVFEGPDGWEMYDLAADPGEANNLASTNYLTLRTMADKLRSMQNDPRSVYPTV
jgi:arylsulfatase A